MAHSRSRFNYSLNQFLKSLKSLSVIPDKEIKQDFVFLKRTSILATQEVALACLRGGSMPLFLADNKVSHVIIEADWNGCESDDRPYIRIDPLDITGKRIEALSEHASELESEIQNSVWDILSEDEFRSYFTKAHIGRDGVIQQNTTQYNRHPN